MHTVLIVNDVEDNCVLLEDVLLEGGYQVRMEELLDRLLAYCRVGNASERCEQVNLGDLMAEVVEMVVPPTMTVSIPFGLPTIEARKAPLEHVLMNLMSNAVKHHDRSDGCIAIEVSDADQDSETGTLVVEVSDDGPGIDSRYHERIFKIFETLAPRDQVEGSGMGLALVKKIVESQGGSIRVESPGPSGGTSFVFTWPRSPRGR